MATIEERAKEFFGLNADNYDVFDEDISEKLQYGYITGARYQKQLDIERACEWINNNIEGYDCTPTGIEKLLVDFRKAMEG